MQVVLLAAGLGSRLGSLTTQLPKALIPVGGIPLVIHALRFAARLGPTRVVVVGGFQHDLLVTEIESRRKGAGPEAALPLQIVENTHYRDGNLVSLMAARSYLDDDFLILNVDHIFRPAIATIVAPEPTWVTAHIDTDRSLGDDDMKVQRDSGGRVLHIAKTLTAFDCGYVGMTRVPRAAQSAYWVEAEAAQAAEGRAIHVERILARLAQGPRPPECRDISGHGWLEVDTPDERGRAEEALLEPGWD